MSAHRDPSIAAANAVAHAHERRYDEPITPLDYWRSWSWLERALVIAAGATLALGGWVLLIALFIIGGPQL